MRKHIFLLNIIFIVFSFLVADIKQNSLNLNWQLPDQKVVDIFDRPFQPIPSILQLKDKIIQHERSLYIPLEWLAEEIVQYGEINIYEKSRARPRSSYYTGFKVSDISFFHDENVTVNDDFIQRKLKLPENSAFGHEVVSHSQHAFLIFEYLFDKIVLWYFDSESLDGKILLDGGITQVLSNNLRWFPDNENVLVSLIPDSTDKPVLESKVPVGPIVLETTGRDSQNRTFPNLLKNSHEEDLFEYYASIQLAKINTKTGEVSKISNPGIITYCEVSPDGRFLLVKEHIRPFLATVPYYRFPSRWYVIDIEENKQIELGRHQATDYLKAGWVQTGKRWFIWHPFMDATLLYATALDEGNPDSLIKYRDEIRILSYPFSGNGKSFLKSEERLRNIIFADKNTYIYECYNWKTNFNTIYLVNNKKLKYKISERHIRALYDGPGELVTYETSSGHTAMLLKDNYIFFIGDGLSADSRIPFVDKINVDSFIKKRVMEFNDDYYYLNIISFYNNNPDLLIVSKQNRTTPSNLFLVSVKDKKEFALTDYNDNIPELTKLQKRVIRYFREDGVELSGVLYLPENYDGTERIPLLMSAYPREFADIETASQVAHNDNRYTRPYGSSNLYLCLDNVAVLSSAAFPIIGDAETVNNTFMEQTIANAKAAIDYLDFEGIIDRNKAVIYGHSYGAFMVANLLAHSDLFAGGIAQNGAYNRTLTPFGFQTERRTLWQAKETYLKLSPFLYVNQIEKPILLIHSTEDSNPGTYPVQSRRFYEALEGNGKIARFIQLPLEGHSYNARETHLHLLWEYKKFFEDYIN